MSVDPTTLHVDFERAPIVEGVLSIQFSPLGKWGIPQFGLFWSKVRSDYPRFETKEPIIAPNRLLDANHFPVRCWFIDDSNTRVLQLQDDRITLNWRKQNEDQYPHYELTRPRFLDVLQRFVDFLIEENVGRPSVQVCEFSYVNHIDPWPDVGDSRRMDDVFAFWSGGPIEFLKETGVLAFSTILALPEFRGQTTISLQPAIRLTDGKQVLQLTISTLTKPASSEAIDVFKSLDEGMNGACGPF